VETVENSVNRSFIYLILYQTI